MTNALVASCAQWYHRAEDIGHALTAQAQHVSERFVRAVKLRAVREAAAEQHEHDDFRDMTFTFAVIALAAKLAQVDGPASKEEFLAFRELFPMPASEHAKISRLFAMAANDGADVEHYAKQIAGLFPGSPLLRDVMERLFKVAAADGMLGDREEDLLRRVAKKFGIGRLEFARMMRGHVTTKELDPYAVLGVQPKWSDAKIKAAYHRLMQQYHPDTVQAAGGNADEVMVAQRQVAMLNAAYTAIRNQRRS